MENFRDNLARLLGLHSLTAREAAQLLDISTSALSKWSTGTRRPNFETAIRVGEFFGVAADRLARADFADLLANELADPARFRAVEARIHRARAGLQAVPDIEAGKVVEVETGRAAKPTEAEPE